jgi:hypothetical protein
MAVPNIGLGGGGFQISPGVNVTEIDLTTVVPSVATTDGAIAGVFRWGPVDQFLLIDSENALAARYGKPANLNAETWFTAANFLAYGNRLYVSRAANTAATLSAIANTGVANVEAHTIKNEDDFASKQTAFETDVHYIAKFPGALGNTLKIAVCDTAAQFNSTVDLRAATTNTSFNRAETKIAIAVGSNTATITLANSASLAGDTPLPFANTVGALFSVGDILELGNTSIGKQYLKITNVANPVVLTTGGEGPVTNTGQATIQLSLDQVFKLSTNYESNSVSRYWEYFNQVDGAPTQSDYVANFGNTTAQDEMHVVVVDAGGQFSGAPGTVLEVFGNVSRATDAKNADGGANYYKTIINNSSAYVWVASDRPTAVSATAALVANASGTAPLSLRLAYGADGAGEEAISFGDIARAYDVYQSAESVDISLLLTGKARGGIAGEQLANYLIDNIAETRKDCVVFLSPDKSDVVNTAGGSMSANIIAFRNALRSSSYAVMDSGYKYQYDKYNDVYRWVPLNGDIAGLAVRTDSIADPWFSPAGTARGQIKNVIKLAYNPAKAERDVLYKVGVNPVVTFPGQGTILYGDKTLLNKPSAFDRINVRRLFITLEKAIANAAKFTLFEFNDEFTRAQFKSLIEPFLRDVQGRRGIIDYRVVCDETNNTTEVVDSNRFVGDIYVKPAKSINYIQLNFVAVRSGVEFTEVAGV